MDLNSLTHNELLDHVASLADDDKEGLRAVATFLNISFSGNTGAKTLRENITAELNKTQLPDLSNGPAFSDNGPTDDELDNNNSMDPAMAALLASTQKDKESVGGTGPKVWTDEELLAIDINDLQNQTKDEALLRRAMKLKHLRLVRVQIVNLNPADSAIPGGIVTVVNPYLGKISKFIPYGEESENGYHVPAILVEELRQWKFPMRKENKRNKFGVKTYRTVMAPRFSITELPPLTQEELAEMGKRQAAAQSIDI